MSKRLLLSVSFSTFLSVITGCSVCCECMAQTTQLPAAAVDALGKYSKLESATWSWEGSLSYLIAGKKANYTTAGSYARSEHKFAWTRQLTEGKKSILDRMVRFDGSTLASANGKDQMTWYAIEKISSGQPNQFSFSIPYFDAIGIQYPKDNKSLAGGPFKSKILHLLESGAELARCVEEKLGDKLVLLVELEADHEELVPDKTNVPQRDRLLYYLSIAEDYAVIKHKRESTLGKTSFEATVKSVSSASVDLPKLGTEVTIKSYVKLGEAEFQVMSAPQETTVLKVENPRLLSYFDDDFVIKKEAAKAGATLIDGVTPELQRADGSISVFSMPASPDDLDKAIAAASVKRSVTPRILWGIGLTVLIGGGIAFYLRRRKV